VERVWLYLLHDFSFSGVNEEWSSNCSQREECTVKKSKTGSVPIPFLNPHPEFLKTFVFPFFLVSYYVSRSDKLYFNAERAKRRHSDRMRRGKVDSDAAQDTDVHNYRYASYFSLLCFILVSHVHFIVVRFRIIVTLLSYSFLLHTESLLLLGM